MSWITRRAVMALPGGIAAGAAFTFPTQPVTIVVPYGAGGTTDVLARALGRQMSRRLGVPVIIENKPGANTLLAAEAVARSPKDGHTLFVGGASAFVTGPILYDNVRVAIGDFRAISMMVKVPFVFLVGRQMPVANLAEFIAFARSKPEGLTVGTTGVGSVNHILAEILNFELGIKLVPVPYRGAAQAMNDILSGSLNCFLDGVSGVLSQNASGAINVLGILADVRSDALPTVPTFAELGHPKVEGYAWFGLLAPAGTPDTVIDTLRGAIHEALASQEIKKSFADLGMIPTPSQPGELEEQIKREKLVWTEVIRRTGMKAQ